MEIVMTSNNFCVTKTRKTQAKYWKDVEVGDLLRFSQMVQGQGYGRGLYAVDVYVENVTKGVKFRNTMNQVTSNMRGFEFTDTDNGRTNN